MINIKNTFYTIIITALFTTAVIGEIKDTLFATVGDKALTDSDVINEVKTILIINNQSYSKDKKKELQSLAVRRVIERQIKKSEIEKFDLLKFNEDNLKQKINIIAEGINVDVDGLKAIFDKNDADFEELKESIKTDLLWDSMIMAIYQNKLNVNENEIDQQLANYNKDEIIYEYLLSEIVLKPVESSKLEEELNMVKNMINDIGFKKTAMNISRSPNSAKGGDLGWIDENSLTDKFKSKIISTPLGKVSDPIILPEGIIIFTVRDKRKSDKVIDLEETKELLIKAEKNKMLNMYSLSHYESLTRNIAVNYN